MNINQIYNTYLKQLGWREKLELAELLMQSTLELVRQKEQEKADTTSSDDKAEYTDLQKKLLSGPVMANEDYELYQEKRKHFAQWK